MAVVQSVEADGTWVRIKFAGEIDVDATDLIRQTVDGAVADNADAKLVELDVADVTLIDSTGVGTFVSVHRGLAERGVRVLVTNPVKIVERVMRVTGVHEMLTGTDVTVRRRRSGR